MRNNKNKKINITEEVKQKVTIAKNHIERKY